MPKAPESFAVGLAYNEIGGKISDWYHYYNILYAFELFFVQAVFLSQVACRTGR